MKARLYCDCAHKENGFHQPPERPGWWVAACCDRPAKTYLDAMEEQGHDWQPLVRVQAPARRQVHRRTA